MRLFIVGPQWVGEWTESTQRAAAALGHDATAFYYNVFSVDRLQGGALYRLPARLRPYFQPAAVRLGRAWENNMNRRLVAAVRAARPDVVIILKGEALSEETIVALHAAHRPVVAWWVDDPFRVPKAMRWFRFLDVLYMFDKGRLDEMQAQGCRNIVYLPCACDQTTFRPVALHPTAYPHLNCVVGFVASYLPGRGALLGQMREWEVGLWGPGWQAAPELKTFPAGTWRARRLVAADAAKVYNLARLCPNIHHPQTQVGGLNTRTFEVLAAGGFELVDHVAGLEENFDVGREIVCYDSPEHFRELAAYYLAHPDQRAAISERGRARVLRDHTYEQRLLTILKTLPR